MMPCECGHRDTEHLGYNGDGLLTVNPDDVYDWGACLECMCSGFERE